MKRFFVTTLLFIAFSIFSFAQQGNNQIGFGFEAGFPSGDFSDFKKGPGVYGKALLGVGSNAQVSVSSGLSMFNTKQAIEVDKSKATIVPLLAGYRYHWDGIYLEPQVGYGYYTLKTKQQTGSVTTKTIDKQNSFTWALGGGFKIIHLDLGLRYQQGYPSGNGVGLFMLHAGYYFSW